jgi:hypothetical protein
MLVEEPASGYDLTRKFERVLQRYAWHAHNSQIYPELKQLAADRLVTVAERGPPGQAGLRDHRPGAGGTAPLDAQPARRLVVRNELVLRLFLPTALEPEEARAAGPDDRRQRSSTRRTARADSPVRRHRRSR